MSPRRRPGVYQVPAWGTDALGADSIRVNKGTAHKVGQHLEAVRKAMETGSDRPLREFRRQYGGTIRDLHGQRFNLRLDLDELLMDWESLSDEEQDAILDEFESP